MLPERPTPEREFRVRLSASDYFGCKYHAEVFYRPDPYSWERVAEGNFITRRGALFFARRMGHKHLKQKAQKSEEVYFNA